MTFTRYVTRLSFWFIPLHSTTNSEHHLQFLWVFLNWPKQKLSKRKTGGTAAQKVGREWCQSVRVFNVGRQRPQNINNLSYHMISCCQWHAMSHPWRQSLLTWISNSQLLLISQAHALIDATLPLATSRWIVNSNLIVGYSSPKESWETSISLWNRRELINP